MKVQRVYHKIFGNLFTVFIAFPFTVLFFAACVIFILPFAPVAKKVDHGWTRKWAWFPIDLPDSRSGKYVTTSHWLKYYDVITLNNFSRSWYQAYRNENGTPTHCLAFLRPGDAWSEEQAADVGIKTAYAGRRL